LAVGGALAVALILGLAGVPYLTTFVVALIPLALIRALPPRLDSVEPLEGVEKATAIKQQRLVLGYVVVLILLSIPGSYITSVSPLLIFPDRVHSGIFSWQHVLGSVVFGLAPATFLAIRFRSSRRQLGLAGISRWRWLGPAVVSVLYTVLAGVGVLGSGQGSMPPPALIVAAVVIAFGAAAIPEELLFRALLQTRLELQVGRWPGIVLTAILFGLAHAPQMYFLSSAGTHGPIYVAFMALLNQGVGGLLFGYMWSRYRNLWMNVALHGAVDTVAFVGILGGFIPPP